MATFAMPVGGIVGKRPLFRPDGPLVSEIGPLPPNPAPHPTDHDPPAAALPAPLLAALRYA